MDVCSNDGGGGERVLWCGVEALREALLRRNVPARFVIYTGDDAPAAAILAKTKVPARFLIYTGDAAPAAAILAKTKVPHSPSLPRALVIHFLA
jgi:hypothetical protein